MTLEATLVMPVVLAVFVLLIYSAYYLYGRCVLSQDSYILAFRATRAEASGHRGDMASYVGSRADEKAGKKYFGSTNPKFTPKVSGKKIRVKGKAEVRHSVMRRNFLLKKKKWGYSALGKAKKIEYPEHARRLKRLRDLGTEILEHDYGEE